MYHAFKGQICTDLRGCSKIHGPPVEIHRRQQKQINLSTRRECLMPIFGEGRTKRGDFRKMDVRYRPLNCDGEPLLCQRRWKGRGLESSLLTHGGQDGEGTFSKNCRRHMKPVLTVRTWRRWGSDIQPPSIIIVRMCRDFPLRACSNITQTKEQ